MKTRDNIYLKFNSEEEFKKYAEDNELYYYPDIFDENEEYVEYDIINPENEQTLINALIEKDDVEYEEARKQLKITDKYHEWHDTIADKILEKINNEEEIEEDEIEEEEIKEEEIEEYNKAVEDFSRYSEAEYLFKNDSKEKIEDKIYKNNNLV